MSLEELKEDINYEISQIDKELDSFMPLLDLCKVRDPSLIEITALGSVLHSFYTGIEKIFMMISKRIDKEPISNINWHKDLLIKMKTKTNNRKNIISEDIFVILLEYLNFRHFFRNNYDYTYDWVKLKKLSDPIIDVWGRVRNEINLFLSSI